MTKAQRVAAKVLKNLKAMRVLPDGTKLRANDHVRAEINFANFICTVAELRALAAAVGKERK